MKPLFKLSDSADGDSRDDDLRLLPPSDSPLPGIPAPDPQAGQITTRTDRNSRRWRGIPLVLKLTLAFALTLLVLEFVLLATGHRYWREVLQGQIQAHISAVAASRREMVEAGILLLRQWDPLESTCRHASLSIL